MRTRLRAFVSATAEAAAEVWVGAGAVATVLSAFGAPLARLPTAQEDETGSAAVPVRLTAGAGAAASDLTAAATMLGLLDPNAGTPAQRVVSKTAGEIAARQLLTLVRGPKAALEYVWRMVPLLLLLLVLLLQSSTTTTTTAAAAAAAAAAAD